MDDYNFGGKIDGRFLKKDFYDDVNTLKTKFKTSKNDKEKTVSSDDLENFFNSIFSLNQCEMIDEGFQSGNELTDLNELENDESNSAN